MQQERHKNILTVEHLHDAEGDSGELVYHRRNNE